MKDDQHIGRKIYLLRGKLAHTLQAEEEKELKQWLEASPQREEILEHLKDPALLFSKLDFRQHQEIESDWKMIRIKSGLVSPKRKRVVRVLRYAAVLGGISFALWMGFRHSVSPELPVAQVEADSVQPGSRQAYIELNVGEIIALGKNCDTLLRKIEGGILKGGENGIQILQEDTLPGEKPDMAYNRLVVPRGGEYRLILSDGTKVWLNSDSKLEFPNFFAGRERKVRLAGEAYFEVAKNAGMPFHVQVHDLDIHVLGTSFNVHAYGQNIKTTLVEGAVTLHVGNRHYSLAPGFEADVSRGKVAIRESDVYEQIAWKDGKFVFRAKRLEEVLNTLARWYDVGIVYRDAAVKDLHFTGNILRHSSIREVLKFLEHNRLVKFDMMGRTIVVSAYTP